jgi:hypothetical protein
MAGLGQDYQNEASAHTAHLSLLHAMLASIEVQKDAKRINEIVNHPAVLPWVGFADKGKLDLTEAIASPDVICLLGAYGGVLFNRLQPGLFEAHTQCLPEGRGQWMLACVQAALHYLFTRTEAVEIMTRCPEGNVGAKALARAIHGKYEFTNQVGWIANGRPIPADIYSLRLQDWLRKAPGLVERGQWFHDRLDAEMKRLGLPHPKHADDAEHDRQVGLACEMAMGGQPSKACIFYNRWSCMAGYAPMAMISADPLVMEIHTARLRMVGESFEASPAQAIH